MAPFEQHILCVNAIELSVRVAGPPDGAPVWLLHGFPECWYSSRFQAPALIAAGYRGFVAQMAAMAAARHRWMSRRMRC